MKTKPDADLAKWCALLAENTAPTDTVPPGWLTAREIAAKTKTSLPTLQNKLKRLVESGKAERKNFRIKLEHNVRPVPHYKLK
jgi:DNA-binding Lrp family transcriptional regulator